MAKEKNDIVTTAQLAKVIGKTTRWVNELTRDGVLVRADRGKYLLPESVQRYIAHIQDRVENETVIDYNAEKAGHERAKRQKAELQLAVMKGELHTSYDVEAVMNDMVAAFRSKVLGMPSKLAPQLLGKSEISALLDLLTSEVNEALTELSEYNPQAFLAVSDGYVEVDDDDSD